MNKKEILDLEEKYLEIGKKLYPARDSYICDILAEILEKETLTFDKPRILIIVAILRKIIISRPSFRHFYLNDEYFNFGLPDDHINSKFYFRTLCNPRTISDPFIFNTSQENYFKIEIKSKNNVSKTYLVDMSWESTSRLICLSKPGMRDIEILLAFMNGENKFEFFELTKRGE